MSDDINKILLEIKQKTFATNAGVDMHKKMQRIIIDNDFQRGDSNIISQIKKDKTLLKFFNKNSLVEIPIAGILNDKFVSRRIDRMVINNSEKTIVFLDYKTDTNKDILRVKYMAQLSDYKNLLLKIYPEYKIEGFILWLRDWRLEQVI